MSTEDNTIEDDAIHDNAIEDDEIIKNTYDDYGISKSIENVFTRFASENVFNPQLCFDIELSSLPDSILLRIFRHLSHPELCRIALVCKHWLWVVYDTTLWKILDLSQHKNIQEENIINLIQSRLSPLLKTLDLSNCTYSPNILNELTDHCHKLDTLVLKNSHLKFKEEQDTLSIPHNLIRLDIRNFKAGYRFIHVILKANDMSKLECFGFGNNHYCPIFTDFQAMVTKMHSLRIFECIECDTFNDSHIRVIADQLKFLESLDVRRCDSIIGSSLAYLIAQARILKSLNLCGTSVNDASFADVAWDQSIIEELDLSFCKQITAAGLLNSIPRLKCLQHLSLNSTGNGKAMNGEVLEAVHNAASWLGLEVLNLQFSQRVFGHMLELFQNFSKLQRLSLRSCNHVDYKSISNSLKHFPNLTGLECGSLFSSGERIQGQWINLLRSLGDNCRKIKDLILVRCLGLPVSQITNYRKTIFHVLENCEKLENWSMLYSEQSILDLIQECINNYCRQNLIVTTSGSFPIIPSFRNSLDSELTKQKFQSFFDY